MGPKILTPGTRHGTSQLGQTGRHAKRHEGNPRNAVYDQCSASGADTGYHGRGNAEPRISQREREAQEGGDGEPATHVLGVAHLGEPNGVYIVVDEVFAVRRCLVSHW